MTNNIKRMAVHSFLIAAGCLWWPAVGSAANKAWIGAGIPPPVWTDAANWSNGVPVLGDVAIFDGVGGAVSVNTDAIVTSLLVTGPNAVELTIEAGKTLFVTNAGGLGINVTTADLTINGSGLLMFSTAGGENHLDNGVNAGHTLTLNAKITGATGFEAWRAAADTPGGTIVMGNPGNDFTMNFNANSGHTIVASKLADAGSVSSLGAGSSIYLNYYGTIRYEGAGDSMNRAILLNGGALPVGIGGRIEQAGTGSLILTGAVRNNSNAAQTLVLLGDSASEARISGPVYNNIGTLSILKEGSGKWVLSGSNTFSGSLTVNGGTLGLDSTNAAEYASQIALSGGTTLAINPSKADGFAAVLPFLVVSGNATVDIPDAANASTVTFSKMAVTGTLNITAPNAGTAANRIFITGQFAGVVGPWLTLNGNPATYDSVNGLMPVTISQQTLATKGSALPNDANATAVIKTVGTGGDITLPADPTRLYSLTQTVAGDYATVDTAGKTLYANEIAMTVGAAALTIGVQPQDGALLPPVQVIVANPIIPDNSAVAALNPLIWYDPSDASAVGVTGGAVTGLVNKAGNPALDAAVVRANFSGPFYATGMESHAALPMLKFAITSQGLQSLSNCGISGSAVRTIVAVMSRDEGKECIVSIGNSASGKAFEPYLRNDVTRFGTYSGDIDVGVKPAATPVVMTFLNGVNDDPGTFQGFADGVASATKTRTDLNTDNTPLNLGHRNGGTADGYRGQIGEVLLFNRTLDTTERETVEAYLMAKWQQPKPVIADGILNSSLVLRNESAAPLTVNAAIIEPLGNIISLHKTGAGDLTLTGGASFSGITAIGGGTLTVNTPVGTEDKLGGVISGAGALTKGGDGLLYLPFSAVNTYAGGTTITGGILRVGNNAALGTGNVTISGGTLDIGGSPTVNTLVITNSITISGAGFENKGAIVNNGTAQQNLFQNTIVTLADNATVGGIGPRWDFRGNTTLDLAGHVLTKVGLADLYFSGSSISNAPAGQAIDLQAGTLGLESQSVFAPNDSTRVVNIASGATFGMYNLTAPFNWSIVPADGATLWTYGLDTATNKNVFATDITLNGQLHLTAYGAYGKNLTGLLSGTGGLAVHDGGLLAVSLLSHPANTFSGPVAVSNAVLGLRTPGSLPSFGQLSLTDNALGAGVRVYPSTWTDDAMKALAESGVFSLNTQRLQFDVAAGESVSIANDLDDPFRGAIDKLGAGELALNGNVPYSGHVHSYAGTLLLTNDATLNLGMNSMYIAEGTGADTALVIGGEARLISTDRGFNTASTGINIATHLGKSVVDVMDNASVYGKLIIGGLDSTDTSAVGAVYQSGNASWTSPAGNSNDGRVGRFGYGYWELADNGQIFLKGGTQFGTTKAATSIGILRQTGGSIVFNGARTATPAVNGAPGESYGGTLALSRGGVGIFQFEGGTVLSYGAFELLDDFTDDGSTGVTGGTAIMTVSGTADVTSDRETWIANREQARAVINLNGGKLTTTFLRRINKAGSTAIVNFNGGILSVTNNAGSTKLIVEDTTALPLLTYVHEGGAVIDLGAGVTRTLDVPLRPAEGSGIASIAINAGGSGYIAPPYVTISGGGGSNATAFARIDRKRGAVTDIEITNPGQGYVTLPTVTFSGGGGSGTTVGRTTFLLHNDGGLIKTGPGTLVLTSTNMYCGPTRVEGGALRLAHSAAISPSSELVIGDGILDLGGHTVTNIRVTITGSGKVINGSVVTTDMLKLGDDMATWDAGLEFAALPTQATPGLYEGFLPGNPRNLTDPNPATAIRLGTDAAQTTDVATWGVSNTCVYTGYIWNRTENVVRWTFAKNFDDTLDLYIDDTVRPLDQNTWSALGLVTVELTPGPHRFEARFGQGTGGAGPNVAGWGSMGFGIDFQGQGTATPAFFVPATDPGNGSLFTVNLPAENEPDGIIRVMEGTLQLPAYQPGMWEGRIYYGGLAAGAHDILSPNPCTRVTLDTALANIQTPSGTAQTNATYCYSGYIWNNGTENLPLTLYKNFDDTIDLFLDGTLVAVTGGNSWDVLGLMNITLTPGPHALEIRFGQGAGGDGPSTSPNLSAWPNTVALGVDFQARGAAVPGNFVKFADDNTGTFLTTTLPLGSVTVDVAAGATLDLGGISREDLTITGSGKIINGNLSTNTVISPVGDNRVGPMEVSGIPLNGATYRLTVHDPVGANVTLLNQPGLWEGMIGSEWDMEAPNPKTLVQLTTRAGNGPIAGNGTYAGGMWAGNYHTWVYTGTLWINSPTNVTWTWRFTFDDNVALWLDGELVRYVKLGEGIQYKNTLLSPGPHTIEIRYGDGTGNVGPASGLGGLTYDPLGRGQTVVDNYILLEADNGRLLSLTDDTLDYVCDVITSAGTLDLTGLTITPSDAVSATPPGTSYVIAHADGGFIGVPTLTGFTDKKWSVRRDGTDLLLTTRGGTLMILK